MLGWRLGGGLGLVREPCPLPQARVLAGQDHLQRDDPVEARLAGLVDDPHPAPADLLEDLIVADPWAASTRAASAGQVDRIRRGMGSERSAGRTRTNPATRATSSIRGRSPGNRSCHSSSDGLWPSSLRPPPRCGTARVSLPHYGQPRWSASNSSNRSVGRPQPPPELRAVPHLPDPVL